MYLEQKESPSVFDVGLGYVSVVRVCTFAYAALHD